MSIATAMNLAIALVENKSVVARSIRRSLPLEEVASVRDASSRLMDAVDTRGLEAVRGCLLLLQRRSMEVDPVGGTPEIRQAYLAGVVFVEGLIDEEINKLSVMLGLEEEPEDEARLDEEYSH